ncbi:ATP synthase f1 subunit gamma, putative [Bodo saltans]|uniref:ATP synthase f1 subunit gamma, putative n=1 Tax=Bodo saltans TaxID=75058 RepID=A0A0S4IY14_BODSA|nr:ATP synthase f1 subunit gamma, putative [Bodo saltans]|eukprot:CUG08615.1 ATP synthase f1 subunit gamma, putative [Bodo saltans]
MSGKLRLYKEKLEGYKKFYSIVKTIKMVTMAKFRVAQARVKTRDFTLRYTEKAFSNPSFDEAASTGNVVYVAVTTNRGSCGALNSNTYKYLEPVVTGKSTASIIPIGKKGQDSISKLFPQAFKFSIINDMKNPMNFAYATYVWENASTLSENTDRIQLFYHRFVSAGAQRAAVYNIPSYAKWLESLGDAASTDNQKSRYLFANALMNEEEEFIRDYYDFHASLATLNAVCENELSEQAARLMAVEGQLTNIMQLQTRTSNLYNKTRQSSITASLIEVLSAMSSLEGSTTKGVQRTNFWEGAKL